MHNDDRWAQPGARPHAGHTDTAGTFSRHKHPCRGAGNSTCMRNALPGCVLIDLNVQVCTQPAIISSKHEMFLYPNLARAPVHLILVEAVQLCEPERMGPSAGLQHDASTSTAGQGKTGSEKDRRCSTFSNLLSKTLPRQALINPAWQPAICINKHPLWVFVQLTPPIIHLTKGPVTKTPGPLHSCTGTQMSMHICRQALSTCSQTHAHTHNTHTHTQAQT